LLEPAGRHYGLVASHRQGGVDVHVAVTRIIIGAVRVDSGLRGGNFPQLMAIEPDDGDIYIAVFGSALKAVTIGQSPRQM
jgi:hypothetical protein